VLLSVSNNNKNINSSNNNNNNNDSNSSSNLRLISRYETIINFATTLLAIVPILSCLACG